MTIARPSILISDDQKEALKKKIKENAWAETIYKDVVQSVQSYVDRHVDDPEWIVSRLQMHWKTHATRTFVNGQIWSHVEGNAPVPTPRFAGARDWATDYASPALEDILPFCEDERGLWLQNTKKPDQPWEWVHPRETGHIVEGINERIMGLAEKAAFLYWYTEEEKYAKFAADILWTYVYGLHFRANPETYENHERAHIIGVATFEVIHERITAPLAVAYDFLRAYLAGAGRDLALIDGVLKRWADRIIEGGFARGNWNFHQAKYIVHLGLSLEPDDAYADGRGREHYVASFTHESTENQASLQDIVPARYDQESGIWPESPGYAFGVTSNILRLSQLIQNATEQDAVDDYPVIEKAALVVFQYLFPNGLTVGFGDTSHHAPNAGSLELLIARARRKGDTETEQKLTAALKLQIALCGYRRDKDVSLFALTAHVATLIQVDSDSNGLDTRTFYGSPVSLVVQRNGHHPAHGLTASLVGTKGGHMHANGMALELYGQGLVLGPDSGRGVSYWQEDHNQYYRRFPAHNTVIVDGMSDHEKSDHPIDVVHLEPSSASESAISDLVSFSDTAYVEPQTVSDQRRMVGIIRTSPTTGYYVDIFRSRRRDGNDRKHEYLYHSLGQSVDILDEDGRPLALQPTEELSSEKGDLVGYNYFTDKQVVAHDGDFTAAFKVALDALDDVAMRLWMKGGTDRQIFTVLAPHSRAMSKGSAPEELIGCPLPTVILRQPGEAWSRPFVAVYESFGESSGASIRRIRSLESSHGNDLVALAVESNGINELNGRVEYILNATDSDTIHAVEGIGFKGIYGVACVNDQGFQYLYLGNGECLHMDGFGLDAMGESTAACLYIDDGKYIISSDQEIKVNLKCPEGRTDVKYAIAYEIEGAVETAAARFIEGSLEFVIPPVYRAQLRITWV
jgi:hypothetical protein